jgi:hypothetical protein
MLKNMLTAALCLSLPAISDAADFGKVELAPTYIHLDVLRNNNTAKTLELPAVKADGTFILYKGFCLKASGLVASNDGELANASLGFGQIIPVGERIYLTPQAGVGYTYMNTSMTYYGVAFDETLYAVAPYIGLDTSYKITDAIRVATNVQYSWSTSKTTFNHFLPEQKGYSQGFSVGGMFEYDVTDSFSMNIGGAYNASMDKAKNGLRGFGFKYGFSYWL